MQGHDPLPQARVPHVPRQADEHAAARTLGAGGVMAGCLQLDAQRCMPPGHARLVATVVLLHCSRTTLFAARPTDICLTLSRALLIDKGTNSNERRTQNQEK